MIWIFQIIAAAQDSCQMHPQSLLKYLLLTWNICWNLWNAKVQELPLRKKYHEIWTKFNKFIISLDRRPALWENCVALYCAFLVEKGNKSTTIRSYISAIKKVLKENGYDWNDQIVLLNSLTKACRILNDKVKTRLPIQMGLFKLLLFELDRVLSGQSYVVLLYCTLFSLAYYGLMHISDLAVDKLSNHQHSCKEYPCLV